MAIEVRISGRGCTRDDQVTHDPAVVAHCDLCQQDVLIAVSMGSIFACKECIRLRLDATSIASWQLRDISQGGGLPWGKISG